MGTQAEAGEAHAGVEGGMSPTRRIFFLLLALSVVAILLMLTLVSKYPLTWLQEGHKVTKGEMSPKVVIAEPLIPKDVWSSLWVTPHKKKKMEKMVPDYDIVWQHEIPANLTFIYRVDKTVTSKLQCVGNIIGHEVEDLACLPKFNFVPSLKNPCWYEDTNEINGTSVKNLDTGAIRGKESQRLRCLPYFHLLGCAKCSSTDFYIRLLQHPHMLKNSGFFGKETLWWSWRRYGLMGFSTDRIPNNFKRYLSYFDPPAAVIEKTLLEGSPLAKQLITGDGSPPDLWDFRGWPQIPQNRRLQTPQVLTPHLMRHLYPHPRFILLLRNPTDRLYSDFFFLKQGQNPYEFHKAVVVSMAVLRDCERDNSRLWCYSNRDIYQKLRTRIHYGCYAVFLQEWLKVFPMEKFLFLRTEDYSSDIPGHLSLVFQFLGLEPLPEGRLKEIARMERQRVTEQVHRAGPMLPKTRHRLNKFYQACNEELSAMLQDRRFLWLGNSTAVKH